MVSKIADIIIWITLADLVIELGSSKESIAMRIIALMLICIFLTLDKISRKLRQERIKMNDEESRKMNLMHFLYENGIIQPKPEVKEHKKSDSKELKIFLVNGKTLYFNNVSRTKELYENGRAFL